MSKYLIEASYTAEGAKGLMKQGGTARRAVVQKMVESLGGRLEVFYFAFGEKDVYLITGFARRFSPVTELAQLQNALGARRKVSR